MLTRLPTLLIALLLACPGVVLVQSQLAPNAGAHYGSWGSFGLHQDVTITGTVTDVDGAPPGRCDGTRP